MTLSILYILRDAEKTIAKSLDSVKWADEIICVVDTRTKDKTREVIAKHEGNIKLYDYHWLTDSMADARNFAISKCTQEWITVVDDDEEVIKHEIPKSGMYAIATIEDIIGDRTEYFDSIRTFRNVPEIRYSGLIQATVDKSIKHLEKGEADTVIRHYGYDLSRKEQIAKVKANLEKYEKQFAIEPESLTVEYYLCHSYHFLGDFRKAIDYGALALTKEINNGMKAQVCIKMFLCYNSLGLLELGEKWLLKSIEYIPMQILGRSFLVQILDQKGNTILADAQEEIIRKISTNKNSQLPNDFYYTEAQLLNLRSKRNGS